MKSPLPVRDGVNATRLRLPAEGPWETALDYMLHRWGHVDPEGILARFDGGEIVAADGSPLSRRTPLEEHTFIWYYRTLPAEERLPVEVSVLYRDEHLLVADKPHFLPTTPGGTYIQESALVRLRNQLDLPDLVPMHRLDRMTAGVLLFSVNPETRGRYQVLFERRAVRKEYECVSALAPSGLDPAGGAHDAEWAAQRFGAPAVVRNRMVKSRDYLLASVVDGEPNAETKVTLERVGGPADAPRALFRLEPHTGKTHQLRVHMAGLGAGIMNDPFYPELLDKAPDDFARPLQLLARGIRFRDPLTGRDVEYRSELTLQEAPDWLARTSPLHGQPAHT
ncbi:pseudouridylate synthase [Sinomonas cyclohexanicum]|uniref:RNA pseudouridylate synthase n=1 Tax=Sinomonas cyclohexanicum TaxID=322009 RepID=A0ABM7PRG4_SINCY|nr:pseudouridine synthase [Corynebacterium cyclohexanicum]BCT74797.1 pseudouridylate synthase [Corynebacterium cyclohexanicum]